MTTAARLLSDSVTFQQGQTSDAAAIAALVVDTLGDAVDKAPSQNAVQEGLDVKASLLTLATSSGATLIGWIRSATGAILRFISDKLAERVSPEDFGAVGDGVTNDSAAIQAAIDYLHTSGGGFLWFSGKTYACNVIIRTGVTLQGAGHNFGYLGTNAVRTTTLKAFGDGPVVQTPTDGTAGVGMNIYGINFLGRGLLDTTGNGIGVKLNGTTRWCAYRGLGFNQFADQALYCDSTASVNHYSNFLAIGCLLGGNKGTIRGIVELHGGGDSIFDFMELNASQLTALSPGYAIASAASPTTVNAFTAGLALIGGVNNTQISRITGEFCDVGIYSECIKCDFYDNIPNRNWAQGWVDKSSGMTQFATNRIFDNSMAANQAYDAFYRLPGGGGIIVTNLAVTNSGGSNAHRYAVNDQTGDGTASGFIPSYSDVGQVGCLKTFNFIGQFAGPSVRVRLTSQVTATDADTTPTVDNLNFLRLANSAATLVTMFDDGVGGQEITVWIANANNTIVNGGTTIRTTAGTNITAQGFYKFRMFNAVWYQQ